MAYSKVGATIPGLVAGADLTGAQFKFVKLTGDGTIGLAGDGEAAIGVLQNKPNTNEAATVWGAGSVTKLVVGETLVAGDKVASDASGEGATATTGESVRGQCLEGAAIGSLATVYVEYDGIAA